VEARWSAFVEALGARADRPATGWYSMGTVDPVATSGHELERAGWMYSDDVSVPLGPQFSWGSTVRLERSLASQLHSWRFVDPVLLHHQQTDDAEDLRWLADTLEAWRAYAGSEPPERSMAWTPWTVTLRIPRLVNIMSRLARTPLRTWLPLHRDLLIAHAELLATDNHFNQRNNHGFFAAAAQLTAARALEPLVEVGPWRRQAQERFALMMRTQFAEDGGHLEHSPAYHRLLLVALADLLDDELITEGDIPFRIQDAYSALAWMKQPNGTLVQFGDTGQDRGHVRDVVRASPPDAFVLTDGLEGTPGSEQWRVFPHSGYVFVRSPAPGTGGAPLTGCSSLALMSGFHSRAHKHADDLTFVWSEGETEIVVDGGKFAYGELLDGADPLRRQGFYYTSKERQYVESARAHNTVVVGRHGQIDRTRVPYGSGSPRLVDGESGIEVSAVATHALYVHERFLRFLPGRRLVVRDVVSLPEGAVGSIETVTAWLNVNGSFVLDRQDARSAQFVDEGTRRSVLLEVVCGEGRVASIVRGQIDPLAGWRSVVDHELEAVWNVEIVAPARRRTELGIRLSVSWA